MNSPASRESRRISGFVSPHSCSRQEFDVIGTVNALEHSFLDQLTEAAKEEKPDAVVLGEVWEDATTKES